MFLSMSLSLVFVTESTECNFLGDGQVLGGQLAVNPALPEDGLQLVLPKVLAEKVRTTYVSLPLRCAAFPFCHLGPSFYSIAGRLEVAVSLYPAFVINLTECFYLAWAPVSMASYFCHCVVYDRTNV